MFTRFDATKSTKGASKLRRDLINAEIANLRDLLPLPPSTRQRLSQLQLMALVCVYVRKANYFQQVFKRYNIGLHHCLPPNMGFSKSLSGFLMMMTQHGKLLYISDNAAEYLGHSMEDLLIHGDSMYDMIDKQDHQTVQNELVKNMPSHGNSSIGNDERLFLCRMNVSRNARRQMRFGDQKVILVRGHYHGCLPLSSRNEPVFVATCTPIAMPETRECVVQGATNVFTAIHSMDMKFIHIDRNGEFHLGFTRSELHGVSWYHLLHWDYAKEGQSKHRFITQSEQDRSCILLIRLQRKFGDWIWIHCVLQVKDNMENSQQPIIVSTNQILSDREAQVLRNNSWLYNYYTMQTKLQFGLTTYENPIVPNKPSPTPVYYQRTEETMSPYQDQSHSLHHHHLYHHHHHHHNILTTSPYHLQSQQQQQQHQLSHYQQPTASDETEGGGHLYQQLSSTSGLPLTINNNRRKRPTDSEPVDYSVHSSSQDESDVRSPFGVKKERIIVSPESPLSDVDDRLIGTERNELVATGETLLLSASGGGSFGRSRALIKAASTVVVDPADFIDQWNPSPPWSDTTMQKVPDIFYQDLSPHTTIATSPPTCNTNVVPSLTSHHPAHTAFSFDWTATTMTTTTMTSQEQYVPNGVGQSTVNVATTLTPRAGATVPSTALYLEDENYHPYTILNATGSIPPFVWPTEQHRLITLQPPPPPRTPFYVKIENDSSYVRDRPLKDSKDEPNNISRSNI